MKFRCRFPPNDLDIEVPDDGCLGDLFEQVEKSTKLQRTEFSVRHGFPPVEIPGGDHTPLATLDLKSGAVLTIIKNSQADYQAGFACLSPPKKRRRSAPSSSSSSSNIVTLDSKPTPKRKARAKSGLDWGTTKEEWSVGLVETFTKSGGDLNAAERAIKRAFKGAVGRRAASSLAEKRWASAQGKTYTLTELSPMQFSVEFPIGLRTLKKETYTSFPDILLAAIIREVYSSGGESKENLRPYYVAEAQPTVFWNIVRVSDGDFHGGLRRMIPEVNWDFTEERRRSLSEKAQSNLQRKEEKEQTKRERQERLEKLVAAGQEPPPDSESNSETSGAENG
eukprot:Selendium_serpulae@DN5567_c0_g1_i1.p1